MKCFVVSGVIPGKEFYEHVIASNEEEAQNIIFERHRVSKIEHFKCREVSIEQVRLSSLTAGDLMRMINAKEDEE